MKILIIRSAPLTHYRNAHAALRHRYPDAAIAVLTHAASVDAVHAIAPVQIYTYHSVRLHILGVGWKMWWTLRCARFDRIMVLETNQCGQGYGNIHLLAASLGATQIERVLPDGQVRKYIFAQACAAQAGHVVVWIGYSVIWFWLLLLRRMRCG